MLQSRYRPFSQRQYQWKKDMDALAINTHGYFDMVSHTPPETEFHLQEFTSI